MDRASAGEHILVERDRRPLAVLVPYEDALRLSESSAEAQARALAALDRLTELAVRMAPPANASEDDAVAVLRQERLAHQEMGE